MRFLSTLLLLSVLGFGSAQAYQGTLQMTADGSVVLNPLAAKCSDVPQPAAADEMELQRACDPAGKTCPDGYVNSRKYCWGGWKKGIYHCGYACNARANCKWAPHGDYKCDYGRGNKGHGGRNLFAEETVSGLFAMNEEGTVALHRPAKICENQKPGEAYEGNTCVPADGKTCYKPYKRMHKHCWGGWKKGFYRCGVVCVVPRQPTQN
ncbi:hypothetical protein [Bdellovibrio sp. GT3]|uniref:hypothetical protein n=1 Tax=Bdellovibrio sp. GT3 TaxID=3136282 RepID=UPI0030F255E9